MPQEPIAQEVSPASRFSGDNCKAQKAAQRRADQLLVTINTKFTSGASQEFGAGILISVKGTMAYILTAKHVVAKQGAGKPTIEVTIEAANGAKHKLFAEVATRFSLSSDSYRDIAVLQADLGRTSFVPTPDWAILRSQQDLNLKDFVVIGNPGGGGKTSTPKGDGDYKNSQELRVNAGVMAPGYSGGGVFDSSLRLVGLVFEDGGQYAAAYPIDPVIDLLIKAGVPVDLKLAPEAKRSIYLSDVDGTTPELREAGRAAMIAALGKAGFEGGCLSGNSYKLSLVLSGATTSGTSSSVDIVPRLFGPDGGQLQVDKEQMTFIHMIGRSSIYSVDALEGKLSEASDNLVAKIVSKITRS